VNTNEQVEDAPTVLAEEEAPAAWRFRNCRVSAAICAMSSSMVAAEAVVGPRVIITAMKHRKTERTFLFTKVFN